MGMVEEISVERTSTSIEDFITTSEIPSPGIEDVNPHDRLGGSGYLERGVCTLNQYSTHHQLIAGAVDFTLARTLASSTHPRHSQNIVNAMHLFLVTTWIQSCITHLPIQDMEVWPYTDMELYMGRHTGCKQTFCPVRNQTHYLL